MESNKSFQVPCLVYERLRDLPQFVRSLCYNHEGWVVGGGASYLAGFSERVKDWDVIVPVYNWMSVHPIIPHATLSNTFGGFKVDCDGVAIDVWPEDVGHYFMTIGGNYDPIAVQPKTQQVALSKAVEFNHLPVTKLNRGD